MQRKFILIVVLKLKPIIIFYSKILCSLFIPVSLIRTLDPVPSTTMYTVFTAFFLLPFLFCFLSLITEYVVDKQENSLFSGIACDG